MLGAIPTGDQFHGPVSMEPSYRLVISCPDRVGLVAAVSDFIADNGGWITEANHYTDPSDNWFFMRHVIKSNSLPFDAEGFRQAFAPIAEDFDMDWRVTDTSCRPRVTILASKEGHCLQDLLYHWKYGDLGFDIPYVISNHENLRDYVQWYGVPFEYMPVDDDKEAHFQNVSDGIEQSCPDVVVLARYMQILPDWLCDKYPNRIINIHHSFLPSFAGARPYHQAKERGVKLTGATCHYVTSELDAGPIIEQDVIRISHHHSVGDIVRLGRDVEKTVLTRGLRYHLEDRVLIHNNKTIVFA